MKVIATTMNVKRMFVRPSAPPTFFAYGTVQRVARAHTVNRFAMLQLQKTALIRGGWSAMIPKEAGEKPGGIDAFSSGGWCTVAVVQIAPAGTPLVKIRVMVARGGERCRATKHDGPG